MLTPLLEIDFDDLAEPPRYWCDDCRGHRLFYFGMDGYPVCRVCLPPIKESACFPCE